MAPIDDPGSPARLLARYCYEHGVAMPAALNDIPAKELLEIGERVTAGPIRLQVWAAVADLLMTRIAWDQRHGHAPVKPPPCAACALLRRLCSRERRCSACDDLMDPWLRLHDYTTHPGCDIPSDDAARVSGPPADTAQLDLSLAS